MHGDVPRHEDAARAGGPALNPFDLMLAIPGGVLSCLTPEAMLLFPLFMTAAAANGRTGLLAIAAGLGLSLVLAGSLAAAAASSFGFDAVWLRRIACLALLIVGFILIRREMVERLPTIAGGADGPRWYTHTEQIASPLRQFALALLVGTVWIPKVGASLGKATLVAAGTRGDPLTQGVIFVTGASAALPWIVLGQVVALILRPVAPGLTRGMAGKRLLGFALMIVAAGALTGQDRVFVQWADQRTPAWAKALAVRF